MIDPKSFKINSLLPKVSTFTILFYSSISKIILQG